MCIPSIFFVDTDDIMTYIKPHLLLDTNRTRLVRKAHPTESFFNFFSPPVMPSEEELANGEFEDDDLEEIEERLEIDYQIGEDIKERVRILSSYNPLL